MLANDGLSAFMVLIQRMNQFSLELKQLEGQVDVLEDKVSVHDTITISHENRLQDDRDC